MQWHKCGPRAEICRCTIPKESTYHAMLHENLPARSFDTGIMLLAIIFRRWLVAAVFRSFRQPIVAWAWDVARRSAPALPSTPLGQATMGCLKLRNTGRRTTYHSPKKPTKSPDKYLLLLPLREIYHAWQERHSYGNGATSDIVY